MADSPVDTTALADLNSASIHAGPIYVDQNIGYLFFIDVDFKLVYRKTVDGGDIWGSPVVINDANFVVWSSVWFDKHTPGDTGTIIHIGYAIFAPSELRYRSFDTNGDVLGVERTVADPPSMGFGNFSQGYLDICKAVGGNLYFVWRTDGDFQLYRSVDGGGSWADTGQPLPLSADRQIILLPDGASVDPEDMAVLLWKGGTAFTYLKWDNSVPEWNAEVPVASGFTANDDHSQFDAMVRHSDGHVLLVAHEAFDSPASDFKTFDIDLAVPTITPKADIATAVSDIILAGMHIDQITGGVRVAYAGQRAGGQTVGAALDVHFVVSLDGMGTWGPELPYSEDAPDDIRGVWAGRSTPGIAPGRFGPMFFNHDLADAFVNVANSEALDFPAAAAIPPALQAF